MPQLIWSPRSLQDVQRLYRFLAEKNSDAAKRAVKAIRDGIKPRGQHPEFGRPVQGMDPEYREWPIEFGSYGYVVRYRYEGTQTLILAVRHQREAGY